MCRTGTATVAARRCPSHSNPVKVAERNARRREAYKATHSSPNASVESLRSSLEALTVPEGNPVSDYGFQPLTEVRKPLFSGKEILVQSSEELKHLTDDQIDALEGFTEHSYSWINDALYGKKVLQASALTMRLGASTRTGTSAILKRTTDALDGSFMSQPLTDRIVYRGMDRSSAQRHSESRNVNDYVDEKYALGSEVVFDGYQSASLSPIIAADFSSDGGIMFEMRSKTGLSVSAHSSHPNEYEVLTPRSTRWKIVGVHRDVKYTANNSEQSERRRLSATMNNMTVIQMVEVDEEGGELTERTAPPELTDAQLHEKAKL